MDITYSLGENPKWYFVGLDGLPLGAGYMATYNNLNPTVYMPIYEDPAGDFPFPASPIPNTSIQGVLIDENGTLGPIYWEQDSSNPNSMYDIEVYDANGNLVYQMNNYLPNNGGGGGNITEGLNFTNLIVNNVFWRNIEATANPIASQNVLLAPGAHSNFASSTQPTNQGDIRFIKSNLASSDQISFLPFTFGANALAGDVTPPVYLNYSCTGIGGGGETYKYVSYPISTDLQSTSGQSATVTIWARCNSGNNVMSLNLYQFFGDGGGASAAVTTNVQNINLTTSWVKYVFTVTIPSVASKTLGACHNTGLYLQVGYPLSQTTNMDHVKASVYLAPFEPELDYLTNDQIDAVINASRTGDVRISLNSFSPFGYVPCNDLTIGNPSSNATNRADYDTFPLFDCIWNQVSNTYAPLLNSAGSPIARGASSMADFAANNQLTLTQTLGRALACAGAGSGLTSRPLGSSIGSEVITIAAMPLHNHPGSTVPFNNIYTSPGSGGTVAGTGGNEPLNITPQGGGILNVQGAANGNMPPESFYNVFLKL